MNVHAIAFHAEGDIGLVQEVIREILLDHITLVATANHKIIHAMRRVDLHDVPEDRFASDLDHGLGLKVSFFGKARSEATGENDCFQFLYSQIFSDDL